VSSIVSDVDTSLSNARKIWGTLLAVGIALIVLGAAAIIYDVSATIVSIFALGVMIFIAGIIQVLAAFQARGAGHVILFLLVGALELVVGYVLMKDPSVGASAVTLILAVYFMFSGIFRVFYSLWAQFPQYGWAVFSGIVTFALGVMLCTQWPNASDWFLGFAVGLNFLLFGISWTALALKLKPA
jgi:uncharacterized membrane protein HdeD (DUF308 family)